MTSVEKTGAATCHEGAVSIPYIVYRSSPVRLQRARVKRHYKRRERKADGAYWGEPSSSSISLI
jgi:hypothetical protein